MKGRYIVGIDLGTTNCCVAYLDRESPKKTIHPLHIPQLVEAGQVQRKPLLPSFCYLYRPDEYVTGSMALPWTAAEPWLVGAWAEDLGGKVPNKVVSAAKSWLCHSLVGRRDPLLPLLADVKDRISPLEATRRYLRHIALAWNWQMAEQGAEGEISQQTVVITVPASFDEVARRLTAEAAHVAGFEDIVLLEEPLAAFYNWLEVNEGGLKSCLKAGERVLICDVGGGTCDFSIIAVQGEEGALTFQRDAVGDHLLLGGENIDAAIASYAAGKMSGAGEMSPTEWQQLCYQARKAKEFLLSQKDPELVARLVLLGGGAKVVEGRRSCQVSHKELVELLLKGFLHFEPWEQAKELRRAIGMRNVGLPYESEPSFIKQMAAFLDKHGAGQNGPDYILFNGGTMRPALFRQALIEALCCWYPKKKVRELETVHYDAAVSRGAVGYAASLSGYGTRVRCGSARAYFVAVEHRKGEETAKRAMAVLPRGAEAGEEQLLAHTFHLRANRPVSFQMYSSHTRLGDAVGDIVEIDELTLNPMPPIQTLLSYGQGTISSGEVLVSAKLKVGVTSLGTLAIDLLSEKTPHKWSLEFQLQGAGAGQQQNVSNGSCDITHAAGFFHEAHKVLQKAFSKGGGVAPGKAVESLELLLGRSRHEWSPSELRALWPVLFGVAEGRHLSADHCQRWWWLAGYLLRPGIGCSLDEHRMKELWRLLLSEKARGTKEEQRVQLLICLRRVAAGLNKGQQMQMGSDILPALFSGKQKQLDVPKGGGPLNLYQERIRTLASFERLDTTTKTMFGKALLARIVKGVALPCEYWALGRLAARHLLAASLGHVLPASQCALWIESLLDYHRNSVDDKVIPLLDPMARLTGLPEVDLPESLRQRVIQYIEKHSEDKEMAIHLRQVVPYSHKEMEYSFGESLPSGLLLEEDA